MNGEKVRKAVRKAEEKGKAEMVKSKREQKNARGARWRVGA